MQHTKGSSRAKLPWSMHDEATEVCVQRCVLRCGLGASYWRRTNQSREREHPRSPRHVFVIIVQIVVVAASSAGVHVPLVLVAQAGVRPSLSRSFILKSHFTVPQSSLSSP